MATCCQINIIVEARLDKRTITNAGMHSFWWSSLHVIEKPENNGMTTLSKQK